MVDSSDRMSARIDISHTSDAACAAASSTQADTSTGSSSGSHGPRRSRTINRNSE